MVRYALGMGINSLNRLMQSFAFLGFLLLAFTAQAKDEIVIRLGVLQVEREVSLPLSRLDIPPDDLGFQGARLAIQENLTTGRFTGQKYEIEEATAKSEEATAALDELIANGAKFIVTLANASDLSVLAKHAADKDVLLLNAQAEDDLLRTEACLGNVLHLAPSRAIKADGLTQFLLFKKWRKWLLISGSHDEDKLWADALRRSANKFGIKIVDERVFEDTGGGRRSDGGHVLVQRQIPVFTQRAPEYDVLVAADEAEVFAGHPANEAWAATQFQRRFEKLAKRRVRSLDYQAWLGGRVIGEAATRTKSNDVATLKDYILGSDFEIGAFKGTKVTFRPWNQQLRQPVLLAHDRMVVSVSPQEQFVHRVSQLDTLGFDKSESKCTLDQ